MLSRHLQFRFSTLFLALFLLAAGVWLAPPLADARKKEVAIQGEVYQYRSDYLDNDKQKPSGELAWQVKLLGKVQGAPAVDNRSVFVASSTGSVFAFHRQKGVLQWQQALLNDSIDHSSPALSDKAVFITSASGALYALNKGNGKKLWTFNAEEKIASNPVFVEDGKTQTVYVATQTGKLYAIDAESGEKKWRYDTQSLLGASPVVADGMLYIADNRGRCYGIDAQSGKPVWFYTIDGPVIAPAVVAQDTVYFVTSNGALAALQSKTGEKRWRYMGIYSHPILVPPIVVKDTRQGEKVYIADLKGTLTCINGKTQTNLWQRQLSGVVLSTPVLSNGVLYVAMGDGEIWALNALTGVELWKKRVASMIESALLVNHGYLYIGANSGRFYALK